MSDFGVVNAYWTGGTLTLVERAEDGGVRVRNATAEHSCFVLDGDLSPAQWDRLRRSSRVVQAKVEGPYRRVTFVDRDACRDFCAGCEKDGRKTYEGVISPVVRYMADRAPKVARPRICYLDLETDSRVPFSRKEEARTLSWALVDERGREAQAVLAADTDQAERELYEALWRELEGYDLVAAWNGDRFDFEVVKARSEYHGLLGRRREWRRWLWLDQMELFRRMNMSAAESGDEKQSVALEAVAQAVLGCGKKDFDARRTWEAWKAGGKRRRGLAEYNIGDARLMPAIEQKTGYVELLLTLSEACGTFPDSRGINPSVQVEGFLQRLAVQRGHRFPTRLERGEYAGKYKGAWVMEPKCVGMQRDVHVCDFSRLYPSIIISLNMSPETCLGQHEQLGPTHFATAKCPSGFPDPHAWAPPTKVCFATAEQGILPAAVDELIRLRKYWSDLAKSLPPGTPEHKEAERRSAAYKIAANSFYGVIGQASSRFFERMVAESVTQVGVWLIEATIVEAERRGMRCIYGDTDSLFVQGVARQEFEAFVAWCNKDLYPPMLAGVGARECRIVLDYDKAFSRLVIVSKKRYVASYLHSKGKAATRDSKPEIKGLEYKRGDSVLLARRMQQEVAHMLVGYQCEPSERPGDYADLLDRWVARVVRAELRLEEVLVSKRLSKPLDQYARKPLKDGSGFARQLPHIELARELEQRGLDMGEGARVDYVVVGPDEKPQRVVYAEDWDGELDRAGLWATYVYPPTQRLLEAAFPGFVWDDWLDVGMVADRAGETIDWDGVALDALEPGGAMIEPDDTDSSQA